jgi:hypothetical protein
MKNDAFYKLLRARVDEKSGRPMTITRLAELIDSSEPHVNQVINGRRRGERTRSLLIPYLTLTEISVLGWGDSLVGWSEKQYAKSGIESWAVPWLTGSIKTPNQVMGST